MNPKLAAFGIIICAFFSQLQAQSSIRWVQQQIITGNRNLGKSFDYDGKSIIAADYNEAYVIQWKDTCWIKNYRLQLPVEDTMISTGICGNYAVLGSPSQNLAYIYNYNDSDWKNTVTLQPEDIGSAFHLLFC